MQTYDIIMLAVLAGATIFGAWKGLAWQVASLASITASYYVAYRFCDSAAAIMQTQFGTEAPWNKFVALAVLYIGTSLAIWIAFRLVSGFIDRLKLKEFDRQLGALLGLAKGVLLCVILTLFAVTLLGTEQRKAVYQSHSGYYIARLLDKAHGVMPSEVHDAVHPYVHSFDGIQEPKETNQSFPADDSVRTARQP